mgnify:FL=1|jgi:hypothetical protein
MNRKKSKSEKIWAYLIEHPNAKAKDVAKACKCSEKYVYNLRSQIGTPVEVLSKPKIRMRTEVLTSANELVSDKREQEHGDFAENAETTAKLWSAYKGTEFTAHDVPMMLALLKVARAKSKPKKIDNYRDGCGYIALASEQV